MNRFKNSMSFLGDVFVSIAERNAEVKKLTQEILDHSYGVNYDQAEKVAEVLINRAEPIVWK